MAQQLRKQGEDVALLFLLDPPGESTAELAPPVVNRIRRHWKRIESMSATGKIKYLLLKTGATIRGRLTNKLSKNRKKLNPLIGKICAATGRLLPPSVRSDYILDIYGRAIDLYKPQKYSGHAVLVTGIARSYAPPLDWQNLISGELQVCEVSIGHLDMTTEPHVRLWAERLNEALRVTQSGGL
jgi:thioesterase domain-containing protein